MTTETVKTTTKEDLRRFPLEEGFMKDKSINGMLYAKLQNISYLNEETQKRYVYLQIFHIVSGKRQTLKTFVVDRN